MQAFFVTVAILRDTVKNIPYKTAFQLGQCHKQVSQLIHLQLQVHDCNETTVYKPNKFKLHSTLTGSKIIPSSGSTLS
jgi:hypothetical protein